MLVSTLQPGLLGPARRCNVVSTLQPVLLGPARRCNVVSSLQQISASIGLP